MSHTDIISFWFEEIKEEQWFKKDLDFDRLIKERFLQTHSDVVDNSDGWGTGALFTLARIIVLDQFSRNIFRDTSEAFAYDEHALSLAKEAVSTGHDQELALHMRAFVYMPYMHSESKIVHEEALQLFTDLGDTHYLHYEKLHKKIIDQFGRYPHRNEILGRVSTEKELEFLANDAHSSF